MNGQLDIPDDCSTLFPLLNSILRAMPMAGAVVQNGRIMATNRSCTQLFDVPARHFIGQTVEELLGDDATSKEAARHILDGRNGRCIAEMCGRGVSLTSTPLQGIPAMVLFIEAIDLEGAGVRHARAAIAEGETVVLTRSPVALPVYGIQEGDALMVVDQRLYAATDLSMKYDPSEVLEAVADAKEDDGRASVIRDQDRRRVFDVLR